MTTVETVDKEGRSIHGATRKQNPPGRNPEGAGGLNEPDWG